MKESSKKELKNIILQALNEYFQDSGINEILVSLYESKRETVKVVVEQPKKVQSIIKNNFQKMSRIQQLKNRDGATDYTSEDDITAGGSPLPKSGIEGARVTGQLRAQLNEYMDPLENGGTSILDQPNSLPDYLIKGLRKARLNRG